MAKDPVAFERRVDLAMRFLNELTDEKVRLDDLAASLGVVRSNLTKICLALSRAGATVSSRGRFKAGIARQPGYVYDREKVAEILRASPLFKTPIRSDEELPASRKLRRKQETRRLCRSCSDPLPVSRYFQCNKCLLELPSDSQDEFIYSYLGGDLTQEDVKEETYAKVESEATE